MSNTNARIIEAGKLSAYITSTLKQYATAGLKIHVAVVSAMHVAATSGNPGLLNRIYHGLRTNDQQAVKLYVRRTNILVGTDGKDFDGWTTEQINEAHANGAVLTFKAGEFAIVEGRGHTTDQAKSMAVLCSKRLINPDGKIDRRVLDRNNFAEVKTLTDSDILKAVIKAAKAEPSEKRNVNVSPSVRKMLDDIVSRSESTLEQIETVNQAA